MTIKKLILKSDKPKKYANGFDIYVAKCLIGKKLKKNDIIQINVFGALWDYSVIKVEPRNSIQFTPASKVELH